MTDYQIDRIVDRVVDKLFGTGTQGQSRGALHGVVVSAERALIDACAAFHAIGVAARAVAAAADRHPDQREISTPEAGKE